MKLSSSLLQAITLSVTVATTVAVTTSCEKEKIKKERVGEQEKSGDHPVDCPACGMG